MVFLLVIRGKMSYLSTFRNIFEEMPFFMVCINFLKHMYQVVSAILIQVYCLPSFQTLTLFLKVEKRAGSSCDVIQDAMANSFKILDDSKFADKMWSKNVNLRSLLYNYL